MTLCRAFGPVYNAKNFKGPESIEKGLGRYTSEQGISYFTSSCPTQQLLRMTINFINMSS